MANTNPQSASPKKPKATWKEEKFEEFWSACWNKRDKGHAKPVFMRKAANPELADRIIAAVKRQGPQILQQASKSGITPVYPATWLNGERWEDEASTDLVRVDPRLQSWLEDEHV